MDSETRFSCVITYSANTLATSSLKYSMSYFIVNTLNSNQSIHGERRKLGTFSIGFHISEFLASAGDEANMLG